MIPALLISTDALIKKDTDKYGDEILSAFSDIADSEPKFFKNQIQEVTNLIKTIVYNKNIDDNNLKETATEILVLILERVPSIGKTKSNILNDLIQLIFFNMV